MGSNPTLSANEDAGGQTEVCPRRFEGEMTEWLKVHAWKACVRVTVPWVRIPLSPPRATLIAGPKPCALRSRELRQARKGATVSGPSQVPQVTLGPITGRRVRVAI